MEDARLDAILQDQGIEVYAVQDRTGIEVGMLELDFRRPRECELGYVGLVPELAGHGHGRWLMHHALALAWRPGVERVWVHTCTLDHPRALGFYRASGFTAIKRTIETFRDPRVDGVLPADAAPHVPLLASLA
jgi:N-acetylglutamate synthase-like GNAT family acetyltransferase